MFEHVEDDLECRFCDFHVRRPGAEILIGRDAFRKNVFVDIRKIGFLRLRDFRRGRSTPVMIPV
ncbi:MAG: hypothetical protein EBU57_09865 [Alphaproteobacteria bacterium]|nr:hypothetical protein [Alphaproteobacteria bacterium]